MSVMHINDISELPDHLLREVRNFFETYKRLENKSVVVEDFQSREVALEIIEQSFVDYKAKFPKK